MSAAGSLGARDPRRRDLDIVTGAPHPPGRQGAAARDPEPRGVIAQSSARRLSAVGGSRAHDAPRRGVPAGGRGIRRPFHRLRRVRVGGDPDPHPAGGAGLPCGHRGCWQLSVRRTGSPADAGRSVRSPCSRSASSTICRRCCFGGCSHGAGRCARPHASSAGALYVGAMVVVAGYVCRVADLPIGVVPAGRGDRCLSPAPPSPRWSRLRSWSGIATARPRPWGAMIVLWDCWSLVPGYDGFLTCAAARRRSVDVLLGAVTGWKDLLYGRAAPGGLRTATC